MAQIQSEKKAKSLAEELKKRLQESEPVKTEVELKEKEEEKISKKEIVEEIKYVKKSDKKETLIPLEDYIKCAVHLGTKVITPDMRKFVYKRRADGLAVINTSLIDEKLREAIKFLIDYDPKEIYIVCKREAGWSAAQKFAEVTGIKVFTKKYPPGVTTNLILDDFFESELTIICDPWTDKNALIDTARLKKPIISLCDTNNYTKYITKIIPSNNKSKKSIGCILYILAREYNKVKKIPFDSKLEDFTGSLE